MTESRPSASLRSYGFIFSFSLFFSFRVDVRAHTHYKAVIIKQ